MRSKVHGLGVLALLMGATAQPLLAEEVRIHSPDGAVDMFGELLEVRENELVIQSAVGPMVVDRSKVICEGAACPQDAPAEAATKVVRIYSADGTIDMSAELLDVRENELVVRSAIGPMAIDRSKVMCEGAACPPAIPAEPATRMVRLTSADGTIAMDAELVEVKADVFVVQTAVGQMSVDRARVACEGPACPVVEAAAADFVLSGAEELGQSLMPGLLAAYARSVGASVSGPVAVNATTAQFTVEAGGRRLFAVDVVSGDTESGLAALAEGTAQVAMSLRPARDDEVAAVRNQGRGDIRSVEQEFIIGVDSVVVVVSPRLPVDALSLAQIRDIYTGRTTNWSDLGGPAVPITALAREEGAPARELFDEFVLEGRDLAASTILQENARDIASWVASEPDSIGYVSVDNIRDAKPVELLLNCGLAISTSPFATKAEEYSLGRRVRLYTDNSARSEHLQGFLDFAVSSEADAAYEAAGYVGPGIAVDSDALERRLDHVDDEAATTLADRLRGASRLSLTFRFEAGSPRLDNKAMRDLDRLVEFLAQPENANKEVIFAGFADALGEDAYNTALSLERAEAVLDQFRVAAAGQLGRSQFNALGFGEIAPVDCNDTVQGRSSNRRVEVWLR